MSDSKQLLSILQRYKEEVDQVYDNILCKIRQQEVEVGPSKEKGVSNASVEGFPEEVQD